MDADKTGPVSSLMMCMQMLVSTEGKERSAQEYSELLEKHGFENIQVKRTGVNRDVIFGRRY